MPEHLGSPNWSYLLTREARSRLAEQEFPQLLAKNRQFYGGLVRQIVMMRARLWEIDKAETIEMEDVFMPLAVVLGEDDKLDRHRTSGRVADRPSDAWDAYVSWYTWLVIKELWSERFTFDA